MIVKTVLLILHTILALKRSRFMKIAAFIIRLQYLACVFEWENWTILGKHSIDMFNIIRQACWATCRTSIWHYLMVQYCEIKCYFDKVYWLFSNRAAHALYQGCLPPSLNLLIYPKLEHLDLSSFFVYTCSVCLIWKILKTSMSSNLGPYWKYDGDYLVSESFLLEIKLNLEEDSDIFFHLIWSIYKS